MYNGNNFDVTAKPTNRAFDFNGVSYAAAYVGSVTGEVNFNTIAPYLGIGWGKAPGSSEDSDTSKTKNLSKP